jgi:hypothetical protein
VFTDAFNALNLDDIPIRSDLIILVTSTTEDCYNRFYGQILNLVQQSEIQFSLKSIVLQLYSLEVVDANFGSLEKLEQLMVNLANDTKLVPLQVLPALGQLLIVQHSGRFYRGRVVEIVEDESSSSVLVRIGLSPLAFLN